MHVNAEETRHELTEVERDRTGSSRSRRTRGSTGSGSFLRRTSLDEIPQLFNVLRGDMALVGPRPFVLEESERIDGWAARRFEVRPGLTGLWQVSGRSNLNFDELRRLDYLYVASWSLKWDLRIMWHTPACVLQSRGLTELGGHRAGRRRPPCRFTPDVGTGSGTSVRERCCQPGHDGCRAPRSVSQGNGVSRSGSIGSMRYGSAAVPGVVTPRPVRGGGPANRAGPGW